MFFGEPVEGRESAARRWRSAGLATFVTGMFGGLLAAVGAVMALPDGLIVLGLGLLAVGVIGAFASTVGSGRARDIPWHRSLWLGVKAMGSAVKDLF